MTEFSEILELIADSRERSQDKYFDRKVFAKEQGMKCDSVGWMRLDLRKDFDKLEQISQAASARGMKLRGVYEKKAVDSDAKWYRFSPKNDFAISDWSVHNLGKKYYHKVKAYKAPRGCSIMGQYVSQVFVDGYKELGLTGLDFVWVPDSGKYRAVSFYSPIFLEKAKRCIFPGQMSYLKKVTYNCLSLEPVTDQYDPAAVKECYKQADFPEGRLCETEKYMDNLDVVLPLAVEYDSMPDTDFAYCSLPGYILIFLIRAEALQKMIAAGAVKREDFEPVSCTNPEEQNLLIRECDEDKHGGNAQHMKFLLENKAHFEKLRLQMAAKERPEFVPSEKEVLALLKKYKKKYADYLNRTISKALAEEVENSLYRPLLPYYKVACGGRLAEDTYEYFYYETAVQRNDAWHKEYSGLLQDAVLFGRSADDNYLMLHEDRVYEVSCHDHEIVKQWEHVFLFFYEKLEG